MGFIVKMQLSAYEITTMELFFTTSICQKGRDNVVKEELYQRTSKDVEGYAARLTFKKAKDEGMNIAI